MVIGKQKLISSPPKQPKQLKPCNVEAVLSARAYLFSGFDLQPQE